MDNDNFKKLLGIAGLVIVTKSLIPSDIPNTVELVSIKQNDQPDLVGKVFNDVGIPGIRIVNVSASGAIQTSSSIGVAGFYLLPSIVEVDFQG